MSQNNLFSPTTGTVTGLQLTTNYNNALTSLISANSGTTAPANDQSAAAVQGQHWLDTSSTPNPVRQYSGTAWLITGWLDQANGVWITNDGGGTGTIASAGTTDLGTVLNPVMSVSGTTTITSFGSSSIAGARKHLNFTGILTLAHNATSLILPNNGANIVTAVGDNAIADYLGSGNWRVISYQRASGQPVATSNAPVLLNTLTASNSATLTDTTSFTSTYKFYDLVFVDIVPATNLNHCEMQFQFNGSFQTTGYVATEVSNGTAAQVITYIPCSSTTGSVQNVTPGINGTLTVFNPSSTVAPAVVNGQVTAFVGGPLQQIINVGGFYNSTGFPVTGFQISMNTGNIASGTIYVYGRN